MAVQTHWLLWFWIICLIVVELISYIAIDMSLELVLIDYEFAFHISTVGVYSDHAFSLAARSPLVRASTTR